MHPSKRPYSHQPPSDPATRPEANPDVPGHLWGAAEVRARLKEAAAVLKALPLTARDRPGRLMAHWPDVVRDSLEAYGYQAPSRRAPRPTPAAVSRADAAVPWLLWAAPEAQRVLWARASGCRGAGSRTWTDAPIPRCARSRPPGWTPSAASSTAISCPEAAVTAAFRQGRAKPDEGRKNIVSYT